MKLLLLVLLIGCRAHHIPSLDPHDNTWVQDVCPVDRPELWINANFEVCCDGTSYRGCRAKRPSKAGDDFCLDTPIGGQMSELHLMRDGTWWCCMPGQAINCGN